MLKDESFSKVIIVVLAIAVAVLLLKGAANVTISTTPEQDVISVSATANINSPPDKAELYAKIETLAADAQASQQQNSRISDAVINKLISEGVNKKDIETSQYYLDQKVRYGKEGEQIIEGYVTIHVLKITTEKTTEVGKLIDAAIQGGANGINSIVFTLSDERKAELRNEAIANAAAEAKEKAKTIAESLGVKLGNLRTVSESSFDFRPYYAPLAVAEKATSAPTQVLPQNVEVSATLAVAYSIG
ncbi:SIMPL domain-containing protein [Candidatus Woesearchaeota archaeon]|nr:SIMPL domain-containing protein [Candidatus Woesearchaeota archaeon]